MTSNPPSAAVLDILQQCQYAGISIHTLLATVLSSPAMLSPLLVAETVGDVSQILALLSLHERTSSVTRTWMLSSAASIYTAQIKLLTKKSTGYHFTARDASVEQVQACNIEALSAGMEEQAPDVWVLLGQLLQSDPAIVRKRKMARTARSRQMLRQRDEQAAKDIDEDNGDEIGIEEDKMDGDISMTENEENLNDMPDLEDIHGLFEANDAPDDVESLLERREKTLIRIKQVILMSIMMHNTNQQCNFLQAMVGIFLQACHAPETIVELLAHMGISISLSSVHAAIESLSQKAENQMQEAATTCTAAIAYDNLDINLKHGTPTVENTHESSLRHLTSASIFPLQHGITPTDLDVGNEVYSIFIDPKPISMHQIEKAMEEREAGRIESSFENYSLWKIRADLIAHGPFYFRKFKAKLGEPDDLDCIPVTKTPQIPLCAQEISPNTPSNNAEALAGIFNQMHLGDPHDTGPGAPPIPSYSQPSLSTIPTTSNMTSPPSTLHDIGNYAMLVFGDLLTGQHIRSVQDQRSEGARPFRRLSFLVYVMGLFHFKMACADAIWRIFIDSPGAKKDDNNLMGFIKQIRKNDVKKLTARADFRPMHEVIQHVGIVGRKDLWRLEVAEYMDESVSSLELWAATEPTWEDICKISKQILAKHIAPANMDHIRNAYEENRDEVKENMMLLHRYCLMYEETSYAMDRGDIGRVEATFLPWIYIFAGCGKSKYAAEMKRYLENTLFRFPPSLVNAIRKNILCNPTGKANHFRAIDWVIELNNLYIKRIHGGEFSNRTVDRMIKESCLIEVYRDIRRQFEDMFCLDHRTVRHSPANMTSTFSKLSIYMEDRSSNSFIAGRKAIFRASDMMAVGIQGIMRGEVDLVIHNTVDEQELAELAREVQEIEDDGSLDL